MANPADIYLPEKVELLDYLPEFIGSFKEMQTLQSILGDEVNEAIQSFYKAFYNSFVNYTDVHGIEIFEEMFDINVTSENIDDRRMAVLAVINKALPYSYNGFMGMLEAMCGAGNYELNMDYGDYTLIVKLGIAASAQYKTIKELCAQIVPANILCQVSILYNKYKTVSRLTYGECGTKTFYQLRNSILVEN